MSYPQNRKSYPMSAQAATEYMRRMIAREMRGANDLGPAMGRIEQKFKIPFWTQDHFRKGKAKTCDAGLFQRIREAYLAHCERSLRALEHELEIERAKGNELDADLLAETQALLAKIEKRRMA